MTANGERTNGRLDGALRLAAWGGAAILLLTPLVAMRFTEEVQWTGFDFAAAAVMLGVPLALLEVTLRATGSWAYRAGVAVALGTTLLLTWANLAVGIMGNENNPLNQIFFAVPFIAVMGAFVANFRARGMALAMAVAALAQVATAVVALVVDGAYIFVLTGGFVVMWSLSAWLFRKAAVGTGPLPS